MTVSLTKDRVPSPLTCASEICPICALNYREEYVEKFTTELSQSRVVPLHNARPPHRPARALQRERNGTARARVLGGATLL